MTENIKLNYTLDKLGIVIIVQSPSKHNRTGTRGWDAPAETGLYESVAPENP